MARTKENQKKYEEEFSMIRNLAETTSVKTLQELADEMSKRLNDKFTVMMVRRRLELHPVLAKKIQAKLNENKHAHHPNTEDKTKAPPITVKTVPEEPAKPAEPKDHVTEKALYTIDASICGCPEAMEFYEQVKKEEKAKIAFTSITLHEISNLAKGTDSDGKDAKKIIDYFLLNFQSENSPFLVINIGDGKQLTNDERDNMVVSCCAENNFFLLTCDREMAMKCYEKGITFKFFKQNSCPKIINLRPVTKTQTELFYRDVSTSMKKIYINGKLIDLDYAELKIGDILIISSDKVEYKTFAVFQILSTKLENNAKMLFSKRYKDKSELPEDYLTFAL